jgi:hypothetical protein
MGASHKHQPKVATVPINTTDLELAHARVKRQNERVHRAFAKWAVNSETQSHLDEVAERFATEHRESCDIAREHYAAMFGEGSMAHNQCCELLDALHAAYDNTDTARHREKRSNQMFHPVEVKMRDLSHSEMQEIEVGGETFERQVAIPSTSPRTYILQR